MARLSVHAPIRYNDLFEFSRLSPGHPVWMVTGDCASALVIKGDPITDSSRVDESLLIMNHVSPGGKAVQLTSGELSELIRYTRDLRRLADDDERDVIDAIDGFLEMAMKPHYKFTKMEVLKLTTLGSGNTELSDKKSIKLIAKAANAPGGLEDLGEIIGADMWNSNNDRFAFDYVFDPGTITVNGVKMNYLLNLGNIMVREMAGEYRFVGLDALDPSTSNVDYTRSSTIEKWGFRAFDRRSPSFRVNVENIGESCYQDLKHAIGRKSGLLKQYRLKSGGGPRISKGLMNAITNIERLLKSMYGNGLKNAPKSIQARAQEVGWI